MISADAIYTSKWLAKLRKYGRPLTGFCELCFLIALDCLSSGKSGGPCPLKIEASKLAGDIDDLANKKQARDFSGFHGAWGELVSVDSTGGYFGFFVAF